MAFLFLDSSALAKRYLTEIGSAWVRSNTNPGSGNVCAVAEVTVVEVTAAIFRKHRAGGLTLPQMQSAFAALLAEVQNNFRRVDLTPSVVSEALRILSQYPLRAYDAVQLGTAVFLKQRRANSNQSAPVFVSADANLNQAAVADGLSVDDPNSHP